ncbi:zinc dependent phospholipase C family protein [Ruminococcus sp. CLA-AA-H200]|uniref:Zinc dependent phospholipase C family protein n=1 Tax=Ruminococcus turbiniformis TaxID=2881258 RepID=A0ABS8FZ65_9FIRM|nr:zinc dependent phospholipase C family protein [Ruminococcus turbiniformis]MCC2255348.1 zinc dependent phospholipase C family protein [Ruminococcus turbiniformis]
MPTTYAHYKFGKEVISALPRPLKNSIENNRELFDAGVHGPDLLFYYKPLMKNPVSAQGYDLHDRPADGFFRHALEMIRKSEDPAAARAYIYGFICHFALDSECHPYIEKMIDTSGISHSEIEMEFDRLLLKEDYINPVQYLATKHIHPSHENAAVIAPFFRDLSADTVEKAMRSMILCHKILLAPGMGRRRLLFGGMKLTGKYDSLHGMVMSLEPNPACRDYCRLLKRLYAGAVPMAAGLIIQYQKSIFEDADLPARFGRTFGAGEEWKDLRL